MLKKILIAVVAILACFAVVAAMQPPSFTVTRSATIAAPPAETFALVNDFHQWEAWSPWAKLDPAMKTTYSGSPAGTGAVYTWAGNSDVGEGRMEIIESQPTGRIGIKLDFLKPFASTSTTVFTFKPEGNGTAVNWTMSGENNFISKAFSLFASMDKMIGPDFERGLAQLKAAAESAARKPVSGQ
jgi:uncharacterized protein YndB with AHSA1/START domain